MVSMKLIVFLLFTNYKTYNTHMYVKNRICFFQLLTAITVKDSFPTLFVYEKLKTKLKF